MRWFAKNCFHCCLAAAVLGSCVVSIVAEEVAADRSANATVDITSSNVRERLLNQQHPLAPVLKCAYDGYDRMTAEVHDYSCILVKRERVDGKLGGYQHLRVKIRHEQPKKIGDSIPFSVYLEFLAPSNLKGREVLYVSDENDGDIIARRGGGRLASLTMRLDPRGSLAMDGQRYPVTEIGVQNLVRRLIEVMQEDIQFGECDVKFYRDAKLNGRSCTHLQVTHPVRRSHFRYHLARVLIDNELNVPVYFASYDWPKTEGGEPQLLEEYAYTEMQLNVGLTDRDFDRANPEYDFSNLEDDDSQ